jgi:hypothetical protein
MLGGTEKRTVLLTTVAACGALGIVTASLSGYRTTPLAPFIAAATPGNWSQYAVWEQAVPMVTVLIAVFATRAWPWLLLVGTVMSLPVTLETVLPNTILSHTAMMTASRGGPPVVFIAVLAAAQQLFRQGAKAQGVVVVALGIGAQIFAAGLTGSAWLTQPTATQFWHVGLTVVGVAGAVLAVVTIKGRTDWAVVNRPAARIVTASVGVVLLPLVAVVINDELANTAFGLSGRGLASHPELVPAAVGVVLVVGGAMLCAVAGARVAFVVAVAALTQLGITGPLVLALYSVAVDPVLGWIAAAVGVAAGCVAAVSRWRMQLAVGGGLVSAIVLFVLSAASDGLPERFVDSQVSVVGALLLALLAATATVMVACVAEVPAGVSGVPAAFGPMASTMVLGGTGVIRILYGADSFGVRGYLDPAHHLSVFGVFLVIAALLIGGTAWLTYVRAQARPEKPTAEPTTVA